METVTDVIFLHSKITADGDFCHEIKRCLLLGRKAMARKPRQHIQKQRHYFVNKGPSSQKKIFFSNSHVLMWEVDHKESSALKNWCFWTVVLEKTLESPLNWKEIKPVNPKGNQSWIFIGRTDAEAEAPILCPPDVLIRADSWKRPWCWERLRAAGEGVAEDEMVGWYHWLNVLEFE